MTICLIMEELELTGTDKDNYLNLIITCLRYLIEEFRKKDYQEMVQFNQLLINFFELLRYKAEPKQGDFLGIFENIKVDPEDCGFPTFESRYLLWRLKEKDGGVERLHKEVALLDEEISRKYMDIFFDETTFESLPQIPVINKLIAIREHNEKKFIFNGEEPAWFRRLDFLNRYRTMEIPMDNDIKITYMKSEGKDRYFQAVLKGFDDAKKLWALYEMVFTVSPARWKSEPIDRNNKTKPEFLEKMKSFFSRDPANVYIMLSTMDCIQPKLVKRCEIGPFYYGKTNNKRFVKELFEDKKFPYLMCYRIEYISDQDSIAQNLRQSSDAKGQAVGLFANYLIPIVDKLAIGSEDIKSSPSTLVKTQNYFICPQELRNDLMTKVKFYDNFKVHAI